MAMSNYSDFISGVSIRGIPLQMTNPGKVFWVNNSTVLPEGGIGGSDGNKGSYLQPFSTIDYAIGRCTAGRGDIIFVMPGHAETITTDGGIALDVAGVTLIGLGTGTLRPTITFSTSAAAAVTVSAANVTIMNMVFNANFADVTNAIDVTAKRLTLLNCEFKEAGTDLNFVDIINASSTTNNTADGLHVEGCVSTAIDAAIDSFIVTAADIDRLVVKGNMVSHQHANALYLVEALTGKDLSDCLIIDNYYATLKTSGALLVLADTTTANTGFIARNIIGHRDTATEILITAATAVTLALNYATAAVDASGYLLPAADS